MKNILNILLILLLSHTLFAQAPLGFNYQGIAREADGTPIANQEIAIRVNIIDGPQGNSLFEEVHFLTTNAFGLFTTIVGQGNGNSTLNSVNWAAGNLWLQIELDPDDSGNYMLMGAQQLMSVPYALFAQQSGEGLAAGSGIEINSGKIVNSAPDRPITLTGGSNITIEDNYPNFTIAASSEAQNLSSSESGTNRTIGISEGTSTTISIADNDNSTSNETITSTSYIANNTIRFVEGGENNDISIGTLNADLNANNNNIINVSDPVNAKDAVNLQYLEAKDATDYAFKSIINEVGTGAALTFDLSTFDFDEGNLITTTQVSITEAGVYLFTIKGTSTNNALLVVNVNNTTDYPVGLINLGTYYDTIFLKLLAGDVIELRANTTGSGEIITLEFFGYKI